MNFDKETAVEFGEIRNRLRKEGEMIGDIDTMIAATAATHNLEILTDNTRHFKKIERAQVYSQDG